ncbi:hypothetical protein BB987_21215 [Photorhabdus temperata]|uniref:DUF2829 domain-containing protein n=2 Tax=Photorhabdus khanii TaxID=1004150 RepID=W3V1F7_9GAMM|nr:MW1434 family type I TA system toxin [Photorhabdus khanii]ETS29642.1 Protein of unknown function (DUF2829) [Photorhabdus khanii NC19]MQL48935.1 DUF2829 domain-containing protein [Photorhabdus khanii]OHV57218.1 hypothetical protein BB987_21215 [Photorhabdus temperata]
MSEVNKLKNTICPFDPDQYKKKIDVEVDGIPPVGSLPWALIQVYFGKILGRSKWNANEYIQLTAKSGGGVPVHIEKHDRQSFPFPWEPTPEDLMACDWKLVKAEDCMLSFDLMVGTSKYASDSGQVWGYLTPSGIDFRSVGSPFGTLTNLQNTIGIGNILEFMLVENTIGTFGSIALQFDTQNQPDLGGKNLEVTVDGSTYSLGSRTGSTTYFIYHSGGAPKLGDLLKQNVSKTLHFCLNWK